jgi:hypothetical protein
MTLGLDFLCTCEIPLTQEGTPHLHVEGSRLQYAIKIIYLQVVYLFVFFGHINVSETVGPLLYTSYYCKVLKE